MHIKLLTTILSLTNYCQEVFRPRLKLPGWAMPTLIFSRVGACPPCSPRAGAHGYRFSSCFAHTSRDNLLVSVKSWALFFLKHFSFKSLWHDMMLYTIDRWISVSYAIRRTVRWLPGWSSWLNIRSSTRQTFAFVLTVRVSSLWRCHSFFRWCHTSQIPQQFLKPDIVHAWLVGKLRHEFLCTVSFLLPQHFN